MAQTPEGARKSAAKRAGLTLEAYMAKIAAGEKHCTRCKEWRSVNLFGSDASRPDGRAYTCLVCRRVPERKETKGRPGYFKGKTHTPEAKALMSEARKGKPNGRLGKRHTLEARKKMSTAGRKRALRGPQNPNYRDGKVAERRGQRFSAEYKQWRYDVFSRDGFACWTCGDNRGGNLRAHHILPFALYPHARFDTNNGIALCKDCHDRYHYG